jgi:hypothetical protein
MEPGQHLTILPFASGVHEQRCRFTLFYRNRFGELHFWLIPSKSPRLFTAFMRIIYEFFGQVTSQKMFGWPFCVCRLFLLPLSMFRRLAGNR